MHIGSRERTTKRMVRPSRLLHRELAQHDSAWAGWSRFDIPEDRHGGVHSLLQCTATRLASRKILIEQNIKRRRWPALYVFSLLGCANNNTGYLGGGGGVLRPRGGEDNKTKAQVKAKPQRLG